MPDGNTTLIIAVTVAVVIVNIVTFALYTVDKRRAIRGEWRISEYALLILSMCAGGIGGFAGMFINRHKTRKAYFYLINAAGVINIFAVYMIAFKLAELFILIRN